MAVQQRVYAFGQHPNRRRIQERDDYACARLFQLARQRLCPNEERRQFVHRDFERQLQRKIVLLTMTFDHDYGRFHSKVKAVIVFFTVAVCAPAGGKQLAYKIPAWGSGIDIIIMGIYFLKKRSCCTAIFSLKLAKREPAGDSMSGKPFSPTPSPASPPLQ